MDAADDAHPGRRYHRCLGLVVAANPLTPACILLHQRPPRLQRARPTLPLAASDSDNTRSGSRLHHSRRANRVGDSFACARRCCVENSIAERPRRIESCGASEPSSSRLRR